MVPNVKMVPKIKDGAKNDFAKGQDCAWNDGAQGKKKVPKV